jgi:23S rRNA (guanosine2251-2'-O)-methyltransferase
MDLVCGPNAVFEALRGDRPVVRLLVAREPGPDAGKTAKALEEAHRLGIPIRRVARQELDRLAAARHQGLVAMVGAFRPGRDPQAALDAITGVPLVVVLDGIEDPRNLGAVIRTCECAGVGAVFVPKRRSAPFSEVAVKAAAGALEHLPVVEVPNIPSLLRLLGERGIWTVGLDGSAPAGLDGFDFSQPAALVLGAEGKGLSRLVRERCDSLVSIPMFGALESLNVSVAAGVALYHAVFQRLERGSAGDGIGNGGNG